MKPWIPVLGLIIVFSLLLPQSAEAQRKRRRQSPFRAGLVLGGNLSQIDGDNYNGFDKANLQFGAMGLAILSPRSDLVFELLYITKGSRTETYPSSPLGKERLISTSYMEVPIYYRYRLKEEAPFAYLEAGISYGRLINSEVEEPDRPRDGYKFKELEEEFNRSELSLLFSYGYQPTRHLSFKFRFGIALSEFYSNPEPRGEQSIGSILSGSNRGYIEFMRNYYISVMGQYQF